MVPYYGTNAYALSGGANAVASQYPPKKIIVSQTAFNFLAFNGLNYSNSTAVVGLSNVILDSTVTAVNSSGNMTYFDNAPYVAQYIPNVQQGQTVNIGNESTVVSTQLGVNNHTITKDGVNINIKKIYDANANYLEVTMSDTGLTYRVNFNEITFLPINGVETKMVFTDLLAEGSIWE